MLFLLSFLLVISFILYWLVIELVKSGGKIVKEPQGLFWGRYQAYFSDLDGYYWEVSWGPNFQFDENGLLKF